MRRLEIAGQKFNRLTVIKYVCVDANRHTKWLCRCDCGKEKVISGEKIVSSKTKSCGCLQREFMSKNKPSIKPFGEACFNILYSRYRIQAIKRGLEFSISKDDFRILTKQNCYYCGVKPHQEMRNSMTNGSYFYNGLDRINNKKGYVIKNVVPCCKMCNRAKDTRSQKEFYIWVQKVHRTFSEILQK